MNTEELIAIDLFCTYEGVESTFVHALCERGLITVTVTNEKEYIAAEDLPRVEQLARMHYDLDINLEGLEAISHLLERMLDLQERMRRMVAQARLFDQGSDTPE